MEDNNLNKKEITNDELAAMMQEEFGRVNTKFTGLEGEIFGIKGEIFKMNERLDNVESKMVTKDEFLKAHDEVTVILNRLDQERVFTLERVRSLEEDVKKIKLILKVA